VDVARHARQIALPEIGPEGQARIAAARVAVIGADRAAETAALYLRAAGVGHVATLSLLNVRGNVLVVDSSFPRPAERGEGQGEGSGLPGLLARIDLIVRSGFDDTPLDAEAARLGLPVIAVRATPEAVDMVAFSGRAPSPEARPGTPFQAASTPSSDDASAVLAGTLAAAEALHAIVREASGPFAPRIRHVRLPLDGREPLVQDIGQRQ
jgi:hypothetical protein